MKPQILICKCSSTEHQIVIRHDEENNQTYLHVHLAPRPSFIERVWHAITYIFGYKCKYGAWDEFELTKEHVEVLNQIVKS
jgi:hypothetical protein